MSRWESEIRELVTLHGALRVGELAARLGLSDQTIRRVVRPLVARGEVVKTHGTIVAAERFGDPPFHARMAVRQAEKRRIAEAVLDLVRDGDSLMLDTGSTTAFIARALRRRSRLRIVTNSSFIASTLALVPGNRVYMAGVELRDHDGAAFDDMAFSVLRRFPSRLAILSATAVDPRHGFMVQESGEADVIACLLEMCAESVMAVDCSKFDRSSAVKVANPEKITRLVTDARPPRWFARQAKAWHMQVVTTPRSLNLQDQLAPGA